MWKWLNSLSDTQPLYAIALVVLTTIVFFVIMYIWQRVSEFCGFLFDNGIDDFNRRWSSWNIIKKLLFIIMYIFMIAGWIVFGTILLVLSIITVGSIISKK